MDAQRIVKHARDAGARIEGGERVLENHLHTRAPCAQGSTVQGQEIAAFELDAAGVRFDQPQHSRATVDLPLPEGPASASVSPASM